MHLLGDGEHLAGEILGIPYETYSQGALLPVAYTLGTDFHPAKRLPVENIMHWDSWSAGAGEGFTAGDGRRVWRYSGWRPPVHGDRSPCARKMDPIGNPAYASPPYSSSGSAAPLLKLSKWAPATRGQCRCGTGWAQIPEYSCSQVGSPAAVQALRPPSRTATSW